jgi:hypothetical protein
MNSYYNEPFAAASIGWAVFVSATWGRDYVSFRLINPATDPMGYSSTFNFTGMLKYSFIAALKQRS